jgi:hypothetical protein
MRSLFLSLILLIITVLLFGAFSEAALRVLFANSLDFSMEMWKYAVSLKMPVDNPRLSFVHRPNAKAFLMGVEIATNSSGFRDREFPKQKQPGVYRIVMLGDSTTLGWGARAEDTISKTLERELNRAGRGAFEVINTGIGNYNTVQEVEHYFTYSRAFQPDLVILQYFINDAEPVPVERSAGILGSSYLAAFTVARLDGMLRLAGSRPQWQDYYAGLYKPGAPALEAAKEALHKLAAAQPNLLVTILPELHQINTSYPFTFAHDTIRAAAARDNIQVVDLIGGLRGHGDESTLWVTPTDAHPDAKASSLVARQLTPVILNGVR